MRRHILGIIALALMLIGAGGLYQSRSFSGEISPMAGYLLRAGLMLGALWLALPQLQQLFQRFPPWLLASLGIGALVLFINGKILLIVGVTLLVIVILKFLGKFMQAREKPRSTRPRAPAPRKE